MLRQQLATFLPWSLVAFLPAGFLGVFFFYPLWTILSETVDFLNLLDIWGDNLDILWFTFWQAGVSCLMTVVAAMPVACVLGRFSFRGKSLTRALLLVPFVLPTVVVSAAMLSVFELFGLENQLRHSIWAILSAHVFFNFAVVARTVGSYWAQLNRDQEEAARTMGVGGVRIFTQITLPRLLPAVLSSASVVFLFCFTSFGVILLLGGPRVATLDTEIWRQAVLRQNFSGAGALVILQILAVVALVAVNSWLTSKRTLPEKLRIDNTKAAKKPREQIFLFCALGWSALVLGLPVAIMVERSFSRRDGSYTLAFYRELWQDSRLLFVRPADAIVNSLVYAGIAMTISVVIGVLGALIVSYSRGRGVGIGVDSTMVLPLGASAVALGFGILVALDEPPLDLRVSFWIVPVTHALVGVPFVMRGVVPVLNAVPKHVRESARLLGASQVRLWHNIDLPLASRAILTASGFVLAISMGEFGASLFLVRPDRPTMPVVIYRLLGRPGELAYGQALAMSTILTGMIVVIVILFDSFQHASKISTTKTSTTKNSTATTAPPFAPEMDIM